MKISRIRSDDKRDRRPAKERISNDRDNDQTHKILPSPFFLYHTTTVELRLPPPKKRGEEGKRNDLWYASERKHE